MKPESGGPPRALIIGAWVSGALFLSVLVVGAILLFSQPSSRLQLTPQQEAAAAHAQSQLELNPADQVAALTLADRYMAAKEYWRADKVLKEAIKASEAISADTVPLVLARALLFKDKGDDKLSKELLAEVVSARRHGEYSAVDRYLGIAEYELGDLLMRAGDCDAAVPHLRAAANISVGDADAHYALGRCLRELGLNRAALAPLRSALRLSPGFKAAKEELRIATEELRAHPVAPSPGATGDPDDRR